MSDRIVSVNSSNIDKEVTQSDKPVLIEVYAVWCGPCQHMIPIVEELAAKYDDQCKFAKLNVDEAREIAVTYQITSVPSFLFIKNNQVLGKEIGYMSKEELEEKMASFDMIKKRN